MTYSLLLQLHTVLPIMYHCLASDINISPVLFFSPVVYVQMVYIPCRFMSFICYNRRHATSSGFSYIYSSSAPFVLEIAAVFLQ